MVLPRAIFLAGLLALGASLGAPTAQSFEPEMDWPEVVRNLKAKEGQNFDSDLQLIKAYVFLERRSDAQQVLKRWLGTRQHERAVQRLDRLSTLFFSQEVSNQYYESVRQVSVRKWAEARDILESAFQKEPGNVLVITRLVQVYWQLGLKSAVEEKIKLGLDLHPEHPELKVFSSRLDLDTEDFKSAQKTLLSQKSWIFEHELPTLWYFESLSALKRSSEIIVQMKGLLKKHPHWLEMRWWLVKQRLVMGLEAEQVQAEIKSLIKDPAALAQKLEADYRTGQYFWMSSKTIDRITAEVQAAAASEAPDSETSDSEGSNQ
jgi:hypothetical protein